MRVFNLVFAILFAFFAALQYNDPDPYVWMPIYLYAAVLCWVAFRKRYFPNAYLLGMSIYAVYAIYLFVAEDGVWDWMTRHNAANIANTMKAGQPWIEETREFFGLVILIAVLLIDYFYGRRRREQPAI